MSVYNGSLHVRLFLNKYRTEKLENIRNIGDYSALCYFPEYNTEERTYLEKFEYNYLDNVKRTSYIGQGYDLIFENTFTRNYRLYCTENHLFYVKGKGYISAKYIDWDNIFLDYENRPCKLIRKKKININTDVFNISVKNASGYFFNGILCGNDYI